MFDLLMSTSRLSGPTVACSRSRSSRYDGPSTPCVPSHSSRTRCAGPNTTASPTQGIKRCSIIAQ
ncbi:hypothetical protein BJV78DRAFT_1215416 [Lactifluus subvellereus]|nr:hypothetical protein BJV78DRAFT_1215416 [Lactifluus subvellereus]